jgi:hypothetical protein
MAAQALFYFIAAVLLTLKSHHYFTIKEMEGKLKKY